jgi:hypothetical protein
MSLLNWLGLLWLLVVPALILLYMLRPQRLRKQVPSLRLWRGVPQMERTRTRLRWPPLSLLLVLEILALVVGAFALAQPAITAPAPRTTIVILDASGSMQALDKNETRFNEARDQAHNVISGLAGTDFVTLLRAGANVTTACSACKPPEAERALQAMAPGAGSADIAGALAVASGLARQASGTPDVVVISDGEFAPQAITQEAGQSPDFSLRYIGVGSPVDDLAVAVLDARRPPDGRSGYIAYARVENRGTSDATIQASALADTVPLPVRGETVPAGGNVGITWQVPAGTSRFTVSVQHSSDYADALPADDRAVIFLPTDGEYAVNVVATQPDLYVRALAPIDGLQAVTNTTVPGAAFSIVEGKLPDSLPSGNLLLVAPDGDLKIPAAGTPLHPTGTMANAHPTVVDASHPLLNGIDLDALQVSHANIYRLSGLSNATWLGTLVDSSKGPLVLAGEQDGRRVVVLAFDPMQSNLPKLAAFPLLMANVVDWLYPLADTEALAPGQTLQLPAGSTVQTPSGQSLPVGPSGRFADTDQSGIYHVTGPANGAPQMFAVNMSDDSHAITITGHPELNRPVPATPTGQVTAQAFWLPLAALALALFGGEWLIFCWKRGAA